MAWKQPDENCAPGVEFGGPAPAHVTTDSEEPAGLHLTPHDSIHQAALDRMWGWLFAPLSDEAENGEEWAA